MGNDNEVMLAFVMIGVSCIVLVIAPIIWTILGFVGRAILQQKGYSGLAGFVLGFFLGLVGIAIALVLSPATTKKPPIVPTAKKPTPPPQSPKPSDRKQSTSTKESQSRIQLKCPKCGNVFEEPLTRFLPFTQEQYSRIVQTYGENFQICPKCKNIFRGPKKPSGRSAFLFR